MFPSWAKNILFLLVAMLSGLTLVLIIEGLISGSELLPLNTAVEQAMIQLRTPFLTDFFVIVTNVGSPFVLAFASILVSTILFLRRNVYDAALLLLSLAVSLVAFTILRDTFHVVRPANELIEATGWSFPSGHTSIATAAFFALSYIFFNKTKTALARMNLVLGSFVAVALLGLSRLYLGAHWALDVLGGISLGLLCVSVTVIVFNVFFEHRRSDRQKLGL